MIALSLSLPGSLRTVSTLARSPSHAAALIRRFALARGVSALAVDWSARPAAKRAGG